MKKNILLCISIIFFSSKVFAGTIYCFSANEGNEILKSTISTNFIESDAVDYFIIDDEKKKFKIIKSYGEYKRKLKYRFEDNNDYEFYYYYDDNEEKNFWESAEYKRFNMNEIEVIIDFEAISGKIRRYKYELDRIAGILLTSNIELDANGEEIARDRDDKNIIYYKEDDEFLEHIKKEKYFCEKHKNL